MSDPLRSHDPFRVSVNQPHPDGDKAPDHESPGGRLGKLWHGIHAYGASTSMLDPALATRRGIGALKVSLGVLLITSLFQVVIALSSGSVALLADTIHNFSDALTAIPLWLAFNLARRARNQRYTYGYGRAEDLAGAAIVVLIFASGLEVFYQSVQKMIAPQPVTNLGWVAIAAVIGFLGNELAAAFRLRVGREINSAALVADGRHSQVDGFTSLGVLAGVIGVWLGVPFADPIIGFGIGTMILVTAWSAGRELWYRLMDATDPKETALVEAAAAAIPGVLTVQKARIRWLGHWQYCELQITVAAQLSTSESHRIVENVRHELFHTLPAIQEVTVHVDPVEDQPGCEHLITAHHQASM
jgi:cation diffusion facilitator family transporter